MSLPAPLSPASSPARSFDADLVEMLPKLRVYALSLTRNSDRADDLVQQTMLRSLVGRGSFQTGTNFPAWLFRIQRNEFISGLRSERKTTPMTDAIADRLSQPPGQEAGLAVREFTRAFRTLASDQRQALLLAALEGQSHEAIAGAFKVATGTVKSRISRGRARLRQLLEPERTERRSYADRTLASGAGP